MKRIGNLSEKLLVAFHRTLLFGLLGKVASSKIVLATFIVII